MSRTAKLIATAVATAALSFGSIGLAGASELTVHVSAKNLHCC